jgi:hypothetical protein
VRAEEIAGHQPSIPNCGETSSALILASVNPSPVSNLIEIQKWGQNADKLDLKEKGATDRNL